MKEIILNCGSDARRIKKEQRPAASDGGVIYSVLTHSIMPILVLLSTIQYSND